MSNKQKLKQCPFCGKTAHLVAYKGVVSCTICCSTATEKWWNRRAECPVLRKQITELKERLATYEAPLSLDRN